MVIRPLPLSHQEAIAIVEQMQRKGFPNRENIDAFDILCKKLHLLSPQLEHLHQLSIKTIEIHIQKIKAFLMKEKELPIPMYSAFYAQLVIFDTNLHTFF